MNYYVVVEGKKTESKLYKAWIPYLNSSLTQINYITEFNTNNYLIISGNGFPDYYNTIENGINDLINNPIIDFLVIAVDSEDSSYDEKLEEINNFISSKIGDLFYNKIKIIIQHFCIETWALANRLLIPRNPQDIELRRYINFFNVLDNDPEDIPPYENFNRAQFAEKYLNKAINAHRSVLTYSKSNPILLLDRAYFNQIKSRYDTTIHIRSFGNFINAFINNEF